MNIIKNTLFHFWTHQCFSGQQIIVFGNVFIAINIKYVHWREENLSPQNIPLGHKNYFRLFLRNNSHRRNFKNRVDITLL